MGMYKGKFVSPVRSDGASLTQKQLPGRPKSQTGDYYRNVNDYD